MNALTTLDLPETVHSEDLKIVTSMPPDLTSQFETLVNVARQTEGMKRNADGLIFGLVGLDTIVGIIPVVGALYSGGMGFALLTQAVRANVGLGTKLFGGALMVADIAVGFIPGAGDLVDAVLRNHAFFANAITNAAEDKMRVIAGLQHQLDQKGFLTEQEITQARDKVFRGGASETATYVKLGIIGLLCGGLLYSCHQQELQRKANIQTCIEQGGWFCSLRH